MRSVVSVPTRSGVSSSRGARHVPQRERGEPSCVYADGEQDDPEHAEGLEHPVAQGQLLRGRTVAAFEAQLEVEDGQHDRDDGELEPDRVRVMGMAYLRRALESPQAVSG